MTTPNIKTLETHLITAIETLTNWKGTEHGEQTIATKAQLEGLETQLAHVQKAIEDRDKREARSGLLPSPSDSPSSLASIFIKSDSFERMCKRKAYRCEPVEIPGGFFNFYRQKDLSGALQSATTGAGLVPAMRVPGVVMPPLRTPRLRELLPAFPTTSNAIEYVEETGFNFLYAQLTAQAAAAQKDIVVGNISGFYAGQTIVIATGTAAAETHVIASLVVSTATITTTSNLANTHAAEVTVTSDTYEFTAETTLKPKARITYAEQTSSVKTLASWLPATRQILSDATQLRALIDGRLVESLMIEEERQMLYGTGTTTQIQGIMTATGTGSYAWSSGTSGDTKVDAIRRAMTLAALANYPADACVVNPSDWEDIELAKGTDGHYLITPVMSGAANLILWRVPVVVTSAINAGDFLVGAFALGAAIYDREQATVRIAEQHEDFFTRNMVVVLAEERLTLVVYRPESFVVGDFDSAP